MFGIYELLDYILPSSDRSKHDILRLEYLSACKLTENENNFKKIPEHIPTSMFEPLLQTVIYKCYMEFLNIDFSKKCIIYEDGSSLPWDFQYHLYKREVVFPDTLWILILNWPHSKLVLRNVIPPLHPPFEMFQNTNGPLESIKQAIGDEDDMLFVFRIFCNQLIHFIVNAVFECTVSNTTGYPCSLRMLDVSGLGSVCLSGHMGCFTRPEDILEGIHNSSIDTFGHKIDIFADTLIDLEQDGNFEFSKKLIEENSNPNVGISIYFNKIHSFTLYDSENTPLRTDFHKVLALARCKYMHLSSFDIDRSFVKNICTYLPELIGIGLKFSSNIKNLDFLSAFVDLEQVSLECSPYQGLILDISKMSKGLTYLNLSECSLHGNDLQYLANSIHSNTIIELDISCNEIRNDHDAFGLTTLCQQLKSIKVLSINNCTLGRMSSKAVSKLVDAFKDFFGLEFLSMRYNTFSLEGTHIIVDGLAQNKLQRYLSLDLPRVTINEFDPNIEELEYLHNLCKTFHEKINRYRQSPIYISWVLEEE